ncbi:hypothetical protein [[Pseudopropionibacterium] massiliense]|uniref:hypothetical protein n=1 Tax=[Pseudopropionibacterium] massiliense TaxID=2220000 RepID=UPI00102F2E7B|nr:hypothetical protein [[Pseudopropionibacterium] massiliense]
MTTSPEASQDVCRESARSLAGRMLNGGAACTLVAWRIGSQYDFVAHGLTAQGDIVVAVRPDEDCLLSTLPAGVGTVVRMDLVRHSHDVMLSVIAASAHLLGELVLLPNTAVNRLLAEDQLPERIAELARIGGTRIGLVVTDRILVHDHSGVTPIPWEDVQETRSEVPEVWCDDFEAHDVVAAQGCVALRQVCRAVINGDLPGQASLRPSGPGLCGHVLDKVFCIDVDRSGVTLMHVGDHETATVFARFEERPATLSALTQQVARLVDDSGPVRPQRCI